MLGPATTNLMGESKKTDMAPEGLFGGVERNMACVEE